MLCLSAELDTEPVLKHIKPIIILRYSSEDFRAGLNFLNSTNVLSQPSNDSRPELHNGIYTLRKKSCYTILYNSAYVRNIAHNVSMHSVIHMLTLVINVIHSI